MIAISNALVRFKIVANITSIPACAILVGPLATVGAALVPTSHPACCCQAVRHKLSTDMSLLLCLFVVWQISLLSSERAVSPPYGWRFFSPSPAASRLQFQTHSLQGYRLGSLNCFALGAFINGRTSSGVRGCS